MGSCEEREAAGGQDWVFGHQSVPAEGRRSCVDMRPLEMMGFIFLCWLSRKLKDHLFCGFRP